MMLNPQPRKLNLTRKEMCDILLVLAIAKTYNPDSKRWGKLYEKVKSQFEAQEPEEFKN